ncbi:hypothetical protein [Polaromonas eurypsychrophila]
MVPSFRWLKVFAAVMVISLSTPLAAQALRGDASIGANVFGSPLVISTSDRLAGAIGSVTWKGMEFINSADHGRNLQSASSFDGLGECYNPTEAGSSAYKGSPGVSRGDGAGPTSTSRLLGIQAVGNVLKTTTRMAFWTPAGQPYPRGCGIFTGKNGKPLITLAQNATDLSNDTVAKQVTIGFAGLPNVIEYLVTFHVTSEHKSAAFEALTGYMPSVFSEFWTFDPASASLRTLSQEAGEQRLPIIFSTPDHHYAMGIYAPALPLASFPSLGYGRFAFNAQKTVKWNAVFRSGSVPAGSDHSFAMYVVIGNIEQVQQGMQSTYVAVHRKPVTE